MRVAVVCPGRGTYGRGELGSLTASDRPDPSGQRARLVARADDWRRSIGRATVSELDRMERFGTTHLKGENAAALIFTAGAADFASLEPELEVVAVCGNSMGWYTALHVAGALDFDAGLRVADTMGGLQLEGVVGGQVIVPVVDADWLPDPVASESVASTLRRLSEEGHGVGPSIRLGGFEVLAGDDEAVRQLLLRLPKSHVGKRDYPFQLLGHSAFHTALLQPSSDRGFELLGDLEPQAPSVPLVDGRGHVFERLTARSEELLAYTLRHQVVRTFDFTRSVRVVLREHAPDALVLLGPGDTLGGSLGQIMVAEGWRGLHSRRDFTERQASSEPVLFAMGRPEQFARVVSGP